MKNFYIAVQVEENGKFYAYMLKVSACDNLASKLKIKGLIAANIASTKKECVLWVNAWNESFRDNGTHLFYNDDTPKF